MSKDRNKEMKETCVAVLLSMELSQIPRPYVYEERAIHGSMGSLILIISNKLVIFIK